jgi:hypothetical protein
MNAERLELAALGAWFRRRRGEWLRKTWPLTGTALLLLLTAIACFLIYIHSHVYRNFILELIPVLYVFVVGPVMVLLLFTHYSIYLLPTQDIAFPFDPRLLYNAALKSCFLPIACFAGILWLLPWIVILADLYAQMGFTEGLLLIMFAQQVSIMCATLQLQQFVLIYSSIASFRRMQTYIPSLVLLAFNLPFIVWMTIIEGQFSEMLLQSFLLFCTGVFCIILVGFYIRTAVMPRTFRGYWEK